MKKLVPHMGVNLPPFKVGDRVEYIGDGSSVAKGSFGEVKAVYQSDVEVYFGCGTTLVTAHANVKKAERNNRTYDGYYNFWHQ